MQLGIHALIRWSSGLGTAVLGARRILYLAYPDFLPSRRWQPHSEHARWAGIAVNSSAELILLLILLGIPFLLHLSVRVREGRLWTYPFAVDLAFSAILYGTAYILLPPP